MKKILTLFALLIAFAVNGFAQDTWTVAGSSAVFGSHWDINDDTNNMTYDSNTGLWTLTKSNVTLTEGVDYEYKVVKNHSWDNENYGAGGNWGGSNKVFSVPESASYDVTITFDYENGKTLTENWVKVGTAQNAEITQVDICGEFNSWSVSDDYKFTKGDGDVYTLTLDLSSVTNDQAFKLVINGSEWLGYQSSMSIDAPAGWIEDAGGNDHNYKLKNSTTGYKTYTLTATWVANSDAASGWTLKIEGKDERVLEYYLVGELTGGWPENNEDQTKDVLMTKQTNGLYTYEVASFAAEARKYEYKLRANKIWGLYELPSSGNADYTFAEAGNYKLTFTANVTGEKIEGVDPYTLKLDAKKLEEVSDYYVIGDNGTEWVALGKMDYFADMKQYDYTLDKTWTGKYFAIAPASALNADGSVADWSKVLRPKTDKGNYLVELRNYDDKVVTGGNNVWEKADDITKIRIVYYINQQLFYLYPYSEVTISSAGYATYSHKYDYYVGTEASIVKAVNGGEAELEKLELNLYSKGIPGGTGVILKGSPFNYTIYPYEKNDNNEYVDVTGNMLIGSGNSTFNLNADEYTAYLLQTVNGQTGFQKWNGDTTTPLAAHKAFLAIPNVSAGAPAFISFGGGTTGIEAVTQSQRTGQYYTLDGRRVENPTKGLYIINGKKVVIK